MSEHLLINPDLLYRIYSYKNIEDYYHFSFLPSFSSIEIDVFYDILNSLSLKKLQNMDSYLYKQWSLTRFLLDKESMNERNKELCSINYLKAKIISKESFNNKLCLLIGDDKIIGLYIMNKMIQFLYPC